MAKTIYATFGSEADAERAAGALLDHGVPREAISFIVADRLEPGSPHEPQVETTGPAPFIPAPDVTIPSPPPLPVVPRRLLRQEPAEDVLGDPGYRYDALGAVIPDHDTVVQTSHVARMPGDVSEEVAHTGTGGRHGLDLNAVTPRA